MLHRQTDYHLRESRKFRIGLLTLIALLVLAFILGLFCGVGFSLEEVGSFLIKKLPLIGDKIFREPLAKNIDKVMALRIPRLLLALTVGSGLAVSGALLQALFRNPLADPYFLGISAGASFGNTLALVLLPASLSLLGFGLASLLAFGFALLTMFLVYLLARTGYRLDLTNLILAGIAVSAILTAAVSVMMMVARQRLEQIVLATMGSFSSATIEKVALVFPAVALGLATAIILSRDLNLFLLGEKEASSLGLETESRKKLILGLSSFITSVCVAASGLIWFVGLIVPHFIRLIFGPDHRRLIPLSALGGAFLLMLADTLARTLFEPHELPLGILTASLGGPFFLYLLRYKRNYPFGVRGG